MPWRLIDFLGCIVQSVIFMFLSYFIFITYLVVKDVQPHRPFEEDSAFWEIRLSAFLAKGQMRRSIPHSCSMFVQQVCSCSGLGYLIAQRLETRDNMKRTASIQHVNLCLLWSNLCFLQMCGSAFSILSCSVSSCFCFYFYSYMCKKNKIKKDLCVCTVSCVPSQQVQYLSWWHGRAWKEREDEAKD